MGSALHRLPPWLVVLVIAVIAPVLGGCAHQAHSYGDVEVSTGPINRALGRAALQRRSASAIAIIETDVGRGLGFVIDGEGYIVTNRHVIEDADHVESVTFPALTPPRSYESVQIIYTDPKRDLALLRLRTPDPLPHLPLAERRTIPASRYLHVDDPIMLFESQGEPSKPRALKAVNGSVTATAVYNDAAGPGPYLGVTNRVERGQSGGPILDRYGRAVGVVTWTYRDRDGGFAIPITEVTRMLTQRPELESDGQQMERAQSRSRQFLAALGRGDVDDARRMTSPSHARTIREEAVGSILRTIDGVGLPVLQGFIGAMESIVDAGQSTARATLKLRRIVQRTGTAKFREALGVAGLERDQVVSFFYEFGRAYLAARIVGGESQGSALAVAMQRLRTIDAARTFALADVLNEIGGSEVEIRYVEVVPGAYHPRAIVSLQSTQSTPSIAGQPPASLTLHMRLEWGDWYVAAVGPTPLKPRPT